MASYVILDNGNYVTIIKDGRELSYKKNVLRFSVSPSNPQVLKTYDTSRIEDPDDINVDVDLIEVSGTNSWSNALLLKDALDIVFFASSSSTGGNTNDPSQSTAQSQNTQTLILNDLLNEQRLTNKLLRKIYNPE